MDKYHALDSQLAVIADSCTDAIPVLTSIELDKRRLASALGEEIAELLSFALNEWSELVEELNSPIGIDDRLDLLRGYFYLNEKKEIVDPVLVRAKIVSQLYFDLIYFRDSFFMILKKRLRSIVEHKSRYPNLSEWMKLFGDSDYWERLRALRNGFGHGRWHFLKDHRGIKGIICYPEEKPPYTPHLWTQDDLLVAHALLYCLQCVFFEEAILAMTTSKHT